MTTPLDESRGLAVEYVPEIGRLFEHADSSPSSADYVMRSQFDAFGSVPRRYRFKEFRFEF